MSQAIRVITIDGPAGSGKSTVAKRVASTFGFRMLNSGAIYRALTLSCLRAGIDVENSSAVVAHLQSESLRIELDADKKNQGSASGMVRLNGEPVSDALRGAEVTAAVSAVSMLPEVREYALPLQRMQATAPGLVAEGRDMGTVVFPDAAAKIFLQASLDERARRRLADTADGSTAGMDADEVRSDLARRDRIDSTRAVAPLKAAEDAVVVDTDGKNLDQVTEEVLQAARTRFAATEQA